MKKIFQLLIVFFSFTFCVAQDKDPVSWSYESKLKKDGSYDLIITATLPKPWHIYSQNTDPNGPIPTEITFNANPLITKVGKVTEAGKIEKKYDADLKANTVFYSNKVVFTQNVKVKGKAKTTVTGNINFMVCNDVKCLPPKDVKFSIKL